MFLLVPAYPGCPGSKAVKRSLLFTLDDDAEIKHLMSIKVVSTVAVVDESTPSCSSSSQADANSDLSEINPGSRTRSIVHDYSLLKFDADVEFLLQKANNTFAESGKLTSVGHEIRSRMLTRICADIYENFTAYPSSAELEKVAKMLTDKYPEIKDCGKGYEAWTNSLIFKAGNYQAGMRKRGSLEMSTHSGKRYNQLILKFTRLVKQTIKSPVELSFHIRQIN